MKHQDNRKNKENPKSNLETSHLSIQEQSKQHIGHLKTQEVPIETRNPYFQQAHPESTNNPRSIVAISNVKSRPIALLYAKGHISKAQYKAAERFYIYWRQSQGDLHMGRDYTRQKVECRQSYTHPIERQIESSNHLTTIKTQLGVLGYWLVEQVVGYDQKIKDLTPSKRKQNSLADHLRDCLDLLAFHWGYTNHQHFK
ncbi:hypothetical protein [Bartonella raoultii]|uniref:Uncharacterized protein n=1 Tax=Bartonella raoultii TaxID=1457020 RepID=A0ABS7IBJ3_9HYPH|nr:hypothetical protein [Bartonella raoultii]MBX4336486.1 hypothetical protein [Bartonella raoultii]